jgi:hypothetical protein
MYRNVAVFTMEGDLIGFAIKEDGAEKLQSTHIYPEDAAEDLSKRLTELNSDQDLQAVWPDANDPEVQALVNDKSFEPVEMVWEDVVDMDNSYLVPMTNIHGEELPGVWDDQASVVVMKKAEVPKDPSAYFARTKKACEVVARRRAA